MQEFAQVCPWPPPRWPQFVHPQQRHGEHLSRPIVKIVADPTQQLLSKLNAVARGFLQPHVEILVGTPEPFFLLQPLFQLPALLVDGAAPCSR